VKIKESLLLFFIFLLAGCGDDLGSAPVLTSIRYQSKAYEQGFNEGEAVLGGRASFEDPDGDLALLSTSWQDCGSGPVKKIDFVQKDLQGITSGRVDFVIMIATNCAIGEYTVRISASDALGNPSNLLQAPYSIREPEEQPN
jgi:hypothetical protein